MYRVLVVDDESNVVDWVSDLLEEQTDPELDVCRAYSASDALGYLNRAKIDILISDIRMPKMNGIELMERILGRWPQCKVILLTAYANFDYACRAIQNNVVGYILKDEDDDRILAAVDKAVHMLDEELSKLTVLDSIQKQLDELSAAVGNETLLNALETHTHNTASLSHRLRKAGIHLNPESPFILFVSRIEAVKEKADHLGRLRIIHDIGAVVEYYLGDHFDCYPAEKPNERQIWVLQPKPQSGERPFDPGESLTLYALGMLETIQQACEKSLDVRLSLVVYNKPVLIGQAPVTLSLISALLDRQPCGDSAFVITGPAADEAIGKETGGDMPLGAGPYDREMTAKLKDALFAGNMNEFEDLLQSICGYLERCQNWNDGEVTETYFSLAITLLSYARSCHLYDNMVTASQGEALLRPYNAGSWLEAVGGLRQYALEMARMIRQDSGTLSDTIVRGLKDYIEGNIASDTSLTCLSEKTGYSATYLSHLFRKRTGMTINHYIKQQRLLHIEKLFRDPDRSISEVAQKAGFTSRTYFNSFMRRTTGMSPQEYRTAVLHKRSSPGL